MSESADPSSSSRYFKLGLFMLLGAVLIVAGVIILGAGALFHKTIPAETLVYDSVNGLDVGSSVKYRGVPIGKVSGIMFASAKYAEAAKNNQEIAGDRNVRGILIEMSLDEQAFYGEDREKIIANAKQLIDDGLRARVTPAGISGQSYVDCDILNPTDNPPPPIRWKSDELYIPSARSTIGQVMDAAGDIASELKKAHLGKVVAHFDDLATQATAAVGEVKQTLGENRNNIDRTLSQMPDTAERVHAALARANEILRDPRVERAMTAFSGAGDSADKTLADLRRLVNEAEQLLSGESDDVRSIVNDLRRLAADGAAFTDDARSNPSRVLFGSPPPHSAYSPAKDGK